MTSVVNQFGRYLSGIEHDMVVAAHERGDTSLEIGGVTVEILSADRDEDGNTKIHVEVSLR